MSKSNFLQFLVDETLKLHSEIHLFSDLERKLNDYDIPFLKGTFIPQIQMLRFEGPMGIIDVPANWYCFHFELNEDYHWIQSADDEALLLHVLRKSWSSQIHSLLIMQADGYCYIAGLKESDEFYLQDLVNPQEQLRKAA